MLLRCLILVPGNPFIYRLQNGQPLLYSVAANGRDDGGCHTGSWGDDGDSEPRPVDYVFWPVHRTSEQQEPLAGAQGP